MKSLLLCLLGVTAGIWQRNYTVGEVMKNARQLSYDSTSVKITGYITGKLRGTTYIFEDRTAEIKVEIANRYLPAKPFNDRDEVTIRAWVRYEINQPITLQVNETVINE
ncbi:NirD/YgiW/YdeI family stress tolerance protein [Chitinophaga nivalis]|uniref:NirD/YgiW/YdeI family stress tolerance protein n=1 Tax=Chitinophaga nivalis TaxID=2991709 RepID=A0ABT3IIF3_9BACT|nr:NirD/YgiW/YdeI family stress tolerance protein [Chitinophaga nivalis]MCW3466573.1 NirD/YgiW/YdeI family stress tolerance protein [Chitinophaga nivalis]MCW3483736.1 NirD/YgiW/YdeI family stress tolerance protein [Chitinophaga nivalis]